MRLPSLEKTDIAGPVSPPPAKAARSRAGLEQWSSPKAPEAFRSPALVRKTDERRCVRDVNPLGIRAEGIKSDTKRGGRGRWRRLQKLLLCRPRFTPRRTLILSRFAISQKQGRRLERYG